MGTGIRHGFIIRCVALDSCRFDRLTRGRLRLRLLGQPRPPIIAPWKNNSTPPGPTSPAFTKPRHPVTASTGPSLADGWDGGWLLGHTPLNRTQPDEPESRSLCCEGASPCHQQPAHLVVSNTARPSLPAFVAHGGQTTPSVDMDQVLRLRASGGFLEK